MPLFGFQMRLFSPKYSPGKGKNRTFSPAVSEALLESIRDGQGFFFINFIFLMLFRSTLFWYPQSRIDKLGDLIESSDNGNAFCKVLSTDFNHWLPRIENSEKRYFPHGARYWRRLQSQPEGRINLFLVFYNFWSCLNMDPRILEPFAGKTWRWRSNFLSTPDLWTKRAETKFRSRTWKSNRQCTWKTFSRRSSTLIGTTFLSPFSRHFSVRTSYEIAPGSGSVVAFQCPRFIIIIF